MAVPVRGIVMAVRMRMPGAIGVSVLVLVEDDLEVPAECVGDAAQRLQAWHMIATLKAGDHRFGHAQPFSQLPLRLAGAGAQLEQLARAFRGERGAVV